MLQKVAGHAVDDIRVAWHLFMEDAGPHQGVKLELWLLDRDPVDVEVKVEVVPDRLQIVVDLLHLLVALQHFHCVHLVLDDSVEVFDQLLLQLVRELVVRKVPEALEQ